MTRRPTDTEGALLALLAKGYEFTSACRSLGDAGVKAAFDCILAGWIDRGALTASGRAVVPAGVQKPGLEAPKYLITDASTGKVVS